MKKILINLISFVSLLSLLPLFSKNAVANNLFYDTFNGNGDLNSYNSAYVRLESFNSEGNMIVNVDHVEAHGFDPAYVYTNILDKNKCASLEFNWSLGGIWTGIMFKSIPGIIPTGHWNAFSVHGGDQKWYLYKHLGNNQYSQLEGPISIDNSINHEIKVCLFENTVKGYIDDNLIVNSINDGQDGYFGFSSQIGTKILDNFKIDSNENQTNININVPLLKQTDPAWKNHTYNSANLWNPNDPTINSWGCALTSATMVFRYHGYSKLPGNIDLDPGSLNSWLKKQKDGYIGNGNINWLALSRLSKQSVGLNHIKEFDALEFEKIQSSDKNIVKQDLRNQIPDILSVPGHFIVAKGINNNIITINDPGFNRSSLSDYNNTFSSINRFIKSNTDLSYIMLITQNDIDIELQDELGNKIGDYFIEESINSLSNPFQNNGGQVKTVLLQKPQDQSFNIAINSLTNSDYDINIYLYDKDGEVLNKTESGFILAGQQISVPLYFDSQAELYPRKISFGKFGSDLNKGYRNDKLNQILYIQLNALLNEAEALNRNKQEELALKKLLLFEEKLNQSKNLMPEETYNILFYDVNYLATHL